MPIKLNVPFSEKDDAKESGARWLADKKIWIIPDTIYDISPFQKWLPKEDGYLVRSPLFIAKAERSCWKCGRVTPLIALGNWDFYAIQYSGDNLFEWEKCDYPALFSNIEVISSEVADQLQQKFPFFKKTYSNTIRESYWANRCVHCKVLQGDFYNFDEGGPFCPVTEEEASQIAVEHLLLDLDFYLRGDMSISTAYQWFIK